MVFVCQILSKAISGISICYIGMYTPIYMNHIYIYIYILHIIGLYSLYTGFFYLIVVTAIVNGYHLSIMLQELF